LKAHTKGLPPGCAGGRRRLLVFAVGGLLLLGLPPQGASAVTCNYDPSARLLSLTTTLGDEGTTLRRVGDEIRATEPLEPSINCGGSPTVTNTDRIKILAGGSSDITISLSGGSFAPGATPEPDASPEIEFINSTFADDGLVRLLGGAGGDHFRYMTAGGQSGLNLNPGPDDRDIDLLIRNSAPLLYAAGGPGPDTIDVVGRPKLHLSTEGGRGNDTLIARGGGIGPSLLAGGAGRDRIIGSPGFDRILPGSGPDLVRARGGADELAMQPDQRRDKIDCGPGRDRVRRGLFGGGVAVDPFDRLRSCERVKGQQ
jgi:hypothetical protein